MKNIHFSLKSIPAMFMALTIAAYGLLIPWIGFYWDDWNFAWISHFLGAAEFIPAFRPFRPFLGPVFVATVSLLHESTIGWQLLGLLARFLVGYTAWWSLNQVWPQHRRQILMVSLFLLVFPGYGQQWVAFTHVNQEIIPLLAYILSFGTTALAIKKRDRFLPLSLLSFLLMFVGLFTTEYFIGLEVIRLGLIWVVLGDTDTRKRIIRSLKYWLPYLLFWLADAAWLAYYYRAGGYQSYGMQGFKLLGSAQLLPALLGEFIQTISTAGFAAWFQIFGLFAQPVQSLSFWLSFGLGVISFIGIVFYLSRLELPDGEPGADRWAVQAILIGLVGILAGRLPSWVAGLPLSLDFSWDRFMLSMMIGACFLLAGLVELLIKSDARKYYVVALLLALSVSHQFDNANSYRRDWEQQKQFFWELAWRIPAMQPGTILLTDQMPLQYESDLSLSAPLNWIYAPGPASHELDYILLFSKIRLGQPEFPAIKPGLAVQVPFRTAEFRGSTSNVVVIYLPAQGCLKVLDPVYGNRKTFSDLPYTLTDTISLSDPARILTNAPAPVLPALFGAEPKGSWCYFYEKAELARQNGDWARVAKLGDQAFAAGLLPEEPYEWLPFIEGNARAGKLDQAQKLSVAAWKQTPLLAPGLCEVWSRVQAASPAATAGAQAMLAKFKCQP